MTHGSHVSASQLESSIKGLVPASGNPAEGLFGPQSITWKVNRESALFLAAGRAALLQLAHPWVAAAIAEHSRTLRDPVGRFHNTFRMMFTMVFGSVERALGAARHLHRRHESIQGVVPKSAGSFRAGTRYGANDLDALRWVYATLVDSAVLAYELVLPRLEEDEREQYYAESRKTAALFGIPGEALPNNWEEFADYMDSMYRSEVLSVSRSAQAMAHELQAGAGTWLRPPFWYNALTIYLLPTELRAGFGLRYGDQERRAAERSLRWLRRVYRNLPAYMRFVGPYHEAHGRLLGRSPGLAIQLSNRLWVGQPTLF